MRRRTLTLDFFQLSMVGVRPYLPHWFSLVLGFRSFWGKHGLSTGMPRASTWWAWLDHARSPLLLGCSLSPEIFRERLVLSRRSCFLKVFHQILIPSAWACFRYVSRDCSFYPNHSCDVRCAAHTDHLRQHLFIALSPLKSLLSLFPYAALTSVANLPHLLPFSLFSSYLSRVVLISSSVIFFSWNVLRALAR